MIRGRFFALLNAVDVSVSLHSYIQREFYANDNTGDDDNVFPCARANLSHKFHFYELCKDLLYFCSISLFWKRVKLFEIEREMNRRTYTSSKTLTLSKSTWNTLKEAHKISAHHVKMMWNKIFKYINNARIKKELLNEITCNLNTVAWARNITDDNWRQRWRYQRQRRRRTRYEKTVASDQTLWNERNDFK